MSEYGFTQKPRLSPFPPEIMVFHYPKKRKTRDERGIKAKSDG
jgi:hypothetical protein